MSTGTPRHCKRCGYDWVQRLSRTPKRCANVKCRSPYYDVEPKVVRPDKA